MKALENLENILIKVYTDCIIKRQNYLKVKFLIVFVLRESFVDLNVFGKKTLERIFYDCKKINLMMIWFLFGKFLYSIKNHDARSSQSISMHMIIPRILLSKEQTGNFVKT